MTTKSQVGGGAERGYSLGFVAVLDSKGRAGETLKAILPNLGVDCYHTHSTETMALAADAARMGINVMSSNEREVILLGSMTSEMVSPAETLDWAVSAVIEDRYKELKTLQGVFVLIIVDLSEQTVTVVSDLLGVRPFYVARREGVTILSDRAEAAPRLGGARIDALGMAGWLYFGYPLVNRTLFESVERIAPASVTVFDAKSERQVKFWSPTVAEESIDADELSDGVCQDFVASLCRLLQPYEVGTVLLSGGFDSRLCLLMSLREGGISFDAVTVPYTQAEQRIVDELVNLTGIECRHAEIKGSIWDEFDSMWFTHPDGFPRTKNLTYLCVSAL